MDPASGRVHRFTPAAYIVMGLMDGIRTVNEIWEIVTSKLGDDAPTQDETIQLLGQLHATDVLRCDVTPDTAEILERYRQYVRTQKINPLLRPLSIKIPLFDPDRILDKFAAIVKPFFSLWGALIWLAVTGFAAILAGSHWSELTKDIFDYMLTPRNLLFIWLVFPVVKILHEFGHAFAAKVWGGEVHEMGIMLLVFTPVPYVDVSSSSAFRNRFKRITVAASGMLVELFIASLALFVWVAVEPGMLRNMAYNVILIAGISTVLFNGNPLIRFDGYYIFSDIIEIPNLLQRANKYMGYLIERYLFGVKNIEPLSDSLRERAWFVFYTIASFAYRIFLMFLILFKIAVKFFAAGVVLAIWVMITMVIMPAIKGINYLFNSPRLSLRRGRAIIISSIIAVCILVVVFIVPFPLRTQVEGVVWLPEHSFVRAGTDGFVSHLVTKAGLHVHQGDGLIKNYDPLLDAQVMVMQARIKELESRHRAVLEEDRVQAAIIQKQLDHELTSLARSRERANELLIRSNVEGIFVVPQPEDLLGRFVKKGETLGYIITPSQVSARVIVSQDKIDLVRLCTLTAEGRLAKNINHIFPVSIIREVPAASEELPSKVLSVEGGGKEVIDPRESSGVKTFSRTFQFDIQLPMKWTNVSVGDRVYVRFDHRWEPLAKRWYRSIRNLLLSRLDV
jgi:putative peptide zinc metalloprotease protein